MSVKKSARLRRARRSRQKMRELESVRLCVHRTPRHIYAQVISGDNSQILVSASTLDKELREGASGNIGAASRVGAAIAVKAKSAGIDKVVFDRAGYKYHGRVKALAEAAREAGLNI